MIIIQNAVMVIYYILSAFLAFLLVRNFVREEKKVDDMLMNLIVLIPLLLRLLRVK